MKVKTIDIQGKEWFDRVNGNSYCSSLVTVNYGLKTEKQFRMPYQYGYGSCYEQFALEGLLQRKLINTRSTFELRGQGIILRSNLQEKCLKREVIAFGGGK